MIRRRVIRYLALVSHTWLRKAARGKNSHSQTVHTLLRISMALTTVAAVEQLCEAAHLSLLVSPFTRMTVKQSDAVGKSDLCTRGSDQVLSAALTKVQWNVLICMVSPSAQRKTPKWSE